MNTPTLGNARFVSQATHTISDDVRIPERIEVGSGTNSLSNQTATEDYRVILNYTFAF